MSSKLEPVIWLRVLVTLAYMKGRTDVRTENDVMAILPNFLPAMGYQYFLSYAAPHVCAKGARGAPLVFRQLRFVSIELSKCVARSKV